ncbi:hypothetical protein HMN09_00471000 [Mycena chlorophos]|uniref:F-box domain-containing protein n=1 Tax=Mycena chlorophos TaxID=658473 RepID=A0A8H6TKH2_MYCCL|nr:hypothetical protein HMN09_00471000 [Mycena chlorophos]
MTVVRCSIVELPTDILLLLASWMNVEDLLNFLATCRALQELKTLPTLWLAAIRQTELIRHHPITSFQGDLTSLRLAQLEALAHRAARILRNLDSATPRLSFLGSFATWVLAPTMFIPGTRLLLVQVSGSGELACWDVVTQRCVARKAVPRLELFSVPCVWMGSSAIFGGCARNPEDHDEIAKLATIHIDVKRNLKPVITVVWSADVGHRIRVRYPEQFLTSEVLGYANEDEIIWWDLESDIIQRRSNAFPVDSTHRVPTSGLVYHADSKRLYAFSLAAKDGKANGALHSIALRPSLAGPNAALDQPITHAIPIRFPQDPPPDARLSGFVSMLTSPASHAKYAIPVVTHRAFVTPDETNEAENFLHFFAAPGLGSGDVHSVPYAIPPVYSDVRCEIGVSGRYVALNCAPTHTGTSVAAAAPLIGLVRLRAGEPDLRPLHAKQPPPPGQVALDDILGLLTVRDGHGVVHAYSYSGDWGKGRAVGRRIAKQGAGLLRRILPGGTQ